MTKLPTRPHTQFVYTDEDLGKIWTYDDNVWMPKEIDETNDLIDVLHSGSTVAGVVEIHSDSNTTSLVSNTIPNASFPSYKFSLIAGREYTLDSILLRNFRTSNTSPATTASMTLEVFQGTSLLGDGAMTAADVTTLNSELGSPLYSATVNVSPSGWSSGVSNSISFNFTSGSVLKKGPVTALLTIDSIDGNITYDGAFNEDYAIYGEVVSNTPTSGDLFQYNAAQELWKNKGASNLYEYNTMVRSTVDPVEADKNLYDLGSYWLNTTTNQLFIHSVTGTLNAYYNVQLPFGLPRDNWEPIPAIFENYDRDAVAAINPPVANIAPGTLVYNSVVKVLYVYDGTSYLPI